MNEPIQQGLGPCQPPSPYLPAARRAANRIGLGLLAFLLVPLFVSPFVQLVAVFLWPSSLNEVYLTWVNQIYSMYLVGAPLCLLIMGRPQPALLRCKNDRLSFLQLTVIFCIMEGIGIAGSLLSQLLTAIMGGLLGSAPSSPVEEMLAGTPLWLIFLVVVVIGPILEELICRKAILDRLLPFGERSAILLSALCFGVIHGNFYQLFYATGLGLVLGYVYARTGRLRTVCALHMLFNCLGSFLPLLLTQMLDLTALETLPEQEIFSWFAANALPFFLLILYEVIIYGMAIVGIVFLCIFIRRIQLRPAALPLRSKEQRDAYLGNPGMILFGIAGLLFLFISLFL